MATFTRIANPGGTIGVAGVTDLSIQDGLAAFMASGDNIAGNQLLIICRNTGTDDTTPVDYLQDTFFFADRFDIIAEAGSETGFTDADKGYYLNTNTPGTKSLTIRRDNFSIQGITLRNQAIGENTLNISKSSLFDVNITKCFFNRSAGNAIFSGSNTSLIRIWNNYFYRSNRGSLVLLSCLNTNYHFYNNTIDRSNEGSETLYPAVGFSTIAGLNTGSLIHANNNIITRTTNGTDVADTFVESQGGTFAAASSNNFTQSVHATTVLSGANGNVAGLNLTDGACAGTCYVVGDDGDPSFPDATPFPLSVAQFTPAGAGTDFTADATLPFSDDALGVARPAGLWDAGAFQVSTAVAPTTNYKQTYTY